MREAARLATLALSLLEGEAHATGSVATTVVVAGGRISSALLAVVVTAAVTSLALSSLERVARASLVSGGRVVASGKPSSSSTSLLITVGESATIASLALSSLESVTH